MTDDDDDDDAPATAPDSARRKAVTPAGSVIDDFMAELRERLEGIDWEAQDARVQAARERALAHEERERTAQRAQLMASLRFPTKALEVARSLLAHGGGIAGPGAAAPPVARLRDRLGDRPVVVLSGPTGCGKTVAAVWAALWRCDGAPAFVRAGGFAASSRYDRAERRQLLDAGVLVLDDLGAEYADGKGNLLADLDELVDVFYGSRRLLLITTNVPGKDFPERYGERIASRIREAGRWIELGGAPSLRPAPKNGANK